MKKRITLSAIAVVILIAAIYLSQSNFLQGSFIRNGIQLSGKICEWCAKEVKTIELQVKKMGDLRMDKVWLYRSLSSPVEITQKNLLANLGQLYLLDSNIQQGKTYYYKAVAFQELKDRSGMIYETKTVATSNEVSVKILEPIAAEN